MVKFRRYIVCTWSVLILAAISCLHLSCNSTKRSASKETVVSVKDSALTKEQTTVTTIDSSVTQKEETVTKSIGDSSLQRLLEITMQRDLDYANGEGEFDHSVQPDTSPIVIETKGDKITISAGKRKIDKIKLQDSKQGSKTDSAGTQKSTVSNFNFFDSTHIKDSSRVADSIARAASLKNVQKVKTPWYLWAIGGLTLALITAIVLYIRKPSARKEIVAHLPDPAGIKES